MSIIFLRQIKIDADRSKLIGGFDVVFTSAAAEKQRSGFHFVMLVFNNNSRNSVNDIKNTAVSDDDGIIRIVICDL